MEQVKEPKKFIITEEQLVALLSYLRNRPYAEVYKAIPSLESLQELPECPK